MTNNDIRQFVKTAIYAQSPSIQKWVLNKPIDRASLMNYINYKKDFTIEILLRIIDNLGYEIKIVKKKRKKQTT